MSDTIDRRKALGLIGAGAAAAVIGAAAAGCQSGKKETEIDLTDPSVGKMSTRIDPKTGRKISLLGYGCMRFPTLNGNNSSIDEETAQILVDEAIRRGVNYFDTAWPYHGGNSELFIGKALKKYPRDSYFLASKFPGFLDTLKTKQDCIDTFEKQLEKCGVEYFDYYFLHNLQRVDDVKRVYFDMGALDYLLEQRTKGRIRNLGWSFHGDEEVFDYALSLDVQWDAVLIQLNYADWEYGPTKRRKGVEGRMPTGREMYEKLSARKIPMMLMEPLLGGQLASPGREVSSIMHRIRPEDSPAKWAFRWCGSHDNVLTILSGMTYMEHLVENCRTFSPLEPISAEEQKVLDEAAAIMRQRETIPCTACRYCMPCPFGLDIPAILTYINKCIKESSIPQNEQDPDYARARRAFLIGYDKAATDLRQADKCIGCGKCVRRCPQGIAIPDEMLKITKLVEALR